MPDDSPDLYGEALKQAVAAGVAAPESTAALMAGIHEALDDAIRATPRRYDAAGLAALTAAVNAVVASSPLALVPRVVAARYDPRDRTARLTVEFPAAFRGDRP